METKELVAWLQERRAKPRVAWHILINQGYDQALRDVLSLLGGCIHTKAQHDATGCKECRDKDGTEGCGWTLEAFDEYGDLEVAQHAHDEGYPPDTGTRSSMEGLV